MIHRLIILTLFTTGTALSGVGVATLWTDVGWQGLVTQKHWGQTVIAEGNVHLTYAHLTGGSVFERGRRIPLGNFGMFRYGSGRTPAGWRWVSLTSPLWLFVTVFFVCPGIAYYLGPMRRWERRKRNQCLVCGYNLEGNESGICPECGTACASPTAIGKTPRAQACDSQARANVRLDRV